MLDDAREAGLDPQALAALASELGDDKGVFDVNVPTVAAFAAIATQWRVVGGWSGIRYIGLDYTAGLAALEALGHRVTPELFAGIQIMERAARAVLNGASS